MPFLIKVRTALRGAEFYEHYTDSRFIKFFRAALEFLKSKIFLW